ncbi:hypothetical protein YPC_1001 [Yersinia pestis biovar Medievalis str. Harbin 35]|nr:hypothetical protein YPC_1001 [Yersinia pestis biovar Medievalis str. Harbin 35]EEO75502.1 hypothetical protein YP516_3426 [Yersinia pestis Nepal516]EEO82256.1 hypothetical protein YPF_1066 [Yersinia pestis biovar Orientalis str. India 195]EEO87136.1 hypothetical protein YPH_3070 [Yersinia pestis biovar Orientalis str. PEXU2]EEO91073.1 hypothetical protein YPS_1611 [Yersinia pestis Pestoides A]
MLSHRLSPLPVMSSPMPFPVKQDPSLFGDEPKKLI